MVQNEKVRKEFSQRLAQACKDAGLDEHGRGMAIARALKLSSKGVSKWLNAESLPRQEKMNALAKFLNVDVVWLQHGIVSESSADAEYVGKMRDGLVKVVGEAILGASGAVDMTENRDGWLMIYSDDPLAYGLKVKGDSMWPRIKSGEYVLIEPSKKVSPGDEVFVRTTDGHNMIKILGYFKDYEYQFISVNQTHAPITIDACNVDKIEYVSGILKESRHMEDAEVNEYLKRLRY
ncbi:XRE family transcriptional regulator [Pectobacterium odoriferum]|uniref:XRE family transcriptional regulator n=1 Tax=Pectobacterium odoriferum TaxID=78398 RepID=UPI0005032A1E|nr:S24 family peptidase [Pectobacterium odoriferum]KGA31148.1 repressor [Pectobacterium odoriferum]